MPRIQNKVDQVVLCRSISCLHMYDCALKFCAGPPSTNAPQARDSHHANCDNRHAIIVEWPEESATVPSECVFSEQSSFCAQQLVYFSSMKYDLLSKTVD